jgi:hypothetical protein
LAARPVCRRDLTGDGQYLAPFVEREVRGDEGAAALTRLDDDGRLGEPGDDAISRGEPPGRGLDPRRVLGDDQATCRHLRGERCVGARVVAVDAAPENGDGRSSRERTSMRGRVDPSRETGDDQHAGRRELTPKIGGNGGSVRRAGSRADDCDRRLREEVELARAPYEETGRRIVDGAQERRERRIGARQPAKPTRNELTAKPFLVERAPELLEAARARHIEHVSVICGSKCRDGELAHSVSSTGGR